MPKTNWEVWTHALLLCLAFGAFLPFQIQPGWLPLGVVFALSLLAWFSNVQSEDPFLSTGRVTLLAGLVYANAAALSLSARPSMPVVGWEVGVVLLVYIASGLFAVGRASRKVEDIDHEYFQYSLPSRRLTVDMGRRTGRLDQAQAAVRLQLFVKEGLQFRRLSRVCRLLVLQVWTALLVFAALGLRQPWYLLAFMATSLVVSASATSIASRATLTPGKSWENSWVDNDNDDDDDDEFY